MGRYVPPDAEGVLTANQASGKGHALGARASKLKSEGILTVRFEMPFAVWCDTCTAAHNEATHKNPVLIGQGVRFNAEKKRIGNYYSSPIYSFRMRHAACGGWIEMHTDPKNTAYVVVAGGRKRADASSSSSSTTPDDSLVSTLVIPTAHEQAAQRETAFATLEKTIADRAALAASKERIDEIEAASARQWDDPYARNQALRKTFRVGRHAREREAAKADNIKERMGLGIELLPESEEDAQRARLIEFGRAPAGAARDANEGREAEKAVFSRPLFGAASDKDDAKNMQRGSDVTKRKPPKLLKAEILASKRKESLVSEIMGNTRMASDPFLEPRSSRESTTSSSTLLPGLKRKREIAQESTAEEKPPEKILVVSSGLVDYESD